MKLLGNSIISTFSETWKVANIDFEENQNAHLNILLKKNGEFIEQVDSIEKKVESFSKRFDTIICVNDNLKTGSIKSQDIFSQYKLIEEEQTFPALLSKPKAPRIFLI